MPSVLYIIAEDDIQNFDTNGKLPTTPREKGSAETPTPNGRIHTQRIELSIEVKTRSASIGSKTSDPRNLLTERRNDETHE
jgi:hypothetical protein